LSEDELSNGRAHQTTKSSNYEPTKGSGVGDSHPDLRALLVKRGVFCDIDEGEICPAVLGKGKRALGELIGSCQVRLGNVKVRLC